MIALIFRCRPHDIWSLHVYRESQLLPSPHEYFAGIFPANHLPGSSVCLHGVHDVLQMDPVWSEVRAAPVTW